MGKSGGSDSMKTVRFLILTPLFLITFTESAFAPIFGGFPGLDGLIQRCDAIVVADILEQKNPFKQPRLVGHEDYKVYVLKTIKGDVAEGERMVLSLRFLPLGCIRGRTSSAEFHFGQRQIVFLERKGDSGYASVNYEGGHMEVSPVVDISKLKATTARGIISELLRDFVEFKREELKRLEQEIETILAQK
jgi:hypothetical protein